MDLTNKSVTLSASAQTSGRRAFGQRTVPAILLCLALAACGSSKPAGTVGYVKGFAGMVAADEPRAAMVGNDVLSAGGSAADAAVAMAFTMAVTLPSQASLGSGGACLVYSRDAKKVEALDFVAPPPTRLADTTSRPSAIPALPRGMFTLHAKYGRLRWEQLLSPAESMARLGVPVSRAFAIQLAAVAGPLFEDPESRRIFAKPNGMRLDEGDMMIQSELGGTISRMRSRGAGDLYTGAGGNDLVQSVERAGGSLNVDELRNFIPKWIPPIAVSYGNEIAYFAPPPASAGLLEAEYWALLVEKDRFDSASTDVKPHLFAEILARGFADRDTWLNPEGTSNQAPDMVLGQAHLDQVMAGYSETAHSPSTGGPASDVVAGTGFVAMDKDGNAVSCAVGLNNTFGIGRIAPNTGIVLGAAAGIKGRGPYGLGPMLAINANSNEFRFAGAAAGGPTSAAALIQVALKSLIEGKKLEDAVAATRMFAAAGPDQVFIEPGNPDAAALKARGHEVAESSLPSRVNAARCTSGSPSPSRCQVVTDPRGAGLAALIGRD